MLNARPHTNGNMPSDFKRMGRELHGVVAPVQDALVSIRAEIMNGRNYQHLPAGEADQKRDIDLARVNSYLTALIAMQELGIETFKAGEAA